MKIGDYIKLKRNELGMTQESLAKKIGVSKSAISRYESNDISNMGIDKAQAMSKALQIDPLTLLTGEIEEEKTITEPTSNPIPLIGQIAAGVPILAEENIDDYFYIDKSIKADFCLRIKGDSMIDEGIYEDDIVFIKSQPCIENGEIGAVIIGDEATLKRVYKGDDNVILQPANRNYKAKTFSGKDIRIAGKLVAVLNIRS